MIRRTPLKRSAKPIKRVSDKRRAEQKIYSERRRHFLAKFFLCQVALAENGYDHRTPPALLGNTVFVATYVDGAAAVHSFPKDRFPRSTEVHHYAKRGKNYLNEDTWLAVSSHWHREIENRKSWARSRGYLV